MATPIEKGSGPTLRLASHYPAILGFVLQHRYCTAQQLYQRFPDQIGSYRTATYQAKQLTDAGYLALVPIRDRLPTMPNVYVATPKAFPIIAAAYERTTGQTWQGSEHEQLRAARGYGWHHVRHELAVTDVDIAIAHLAESRGDLHLHHTERRYFRTDKRLTFARQGQRQAIEPDAGYFITHQRHGRRWLDVCFLEYDRGTMAPGRFRDKYHRYEAWAASSRGEDYLARQLARYRDRETTKPTFRLLVVAEARPSERTDWWRQVALFTEALTAERPLRRRIWITAADQVKKHGLQAPIWLRVSDAGPWVHHFRDTTDGWLSHTKRAYVAKRFKDLPQYRLFPPASDAESVATRRRPLQVPVEV